MLSYLEVDSTYRDRVRFPNPSQFEVEISQSGTATTLLKSRDPITLEAPIVTYTPNDINGLLATSIQATNTNSSTSIHVCFPTAQNPSQISNYYRGIQIQVDDTVTPVDYGRITIQTWDYMNSVGVNDCFRVTFLPALSPTAYGTINSLQFVGSTNFTSGLVFIPNGVLDSQVYKDWYVYNETQQQSAQILSYDGNNSLATIAPQAGWALTDVISIRERLPHETSSFQAGSTTTSVILNAAANTTTDFYKNTFIRVTQAGANFGVIRAITAYAGTPTFAATLSSALPAAPAAADTYEILQFDRDNHVPFDYGGSSVQGIHCYEVQLVNLVVPNISLSEGGLVGSYPYLYVELMNKTTAGNYTSAIYSNNPNARRKLFRVPITDIVSSTLDSFITLDRSYLAQIVKVNLYRDFIFGVYLPNGQPLVASTSDTSSPVQPDRNLQISAIFALRRLPPG